MKIAQNRNKILQFFNSFDIFLVLIMELNLLFNGTLQNS